jgi:O-antigen/teichoic acid export membrane protein
MHFHRLLLQSLLWRGLFFLTFFIISILLPRSLQAAGAGWIYYLTNWFSLILLVASLNLESAVGYYASNQGINSNKLAWISVAWTILVGLIVYIVIGFYFGGIRGEEPITKNQYLFFAVSYITGILLMNFYTALFYAKRNFFLPNLLLSLTNIAFIVSILMGESWGITNADILTIYFWYSLSQGLLLMMAYFIRYNSWNIAFPVFGEWKLLMRYALLALVANLVYFLVYRADYWFVRHSPASSPDGYDLGNYIQVSKHGQMLLILPQIIASAVFPQTASETDRQTVRDTVALLSRFFLVIYVLIIAAVAVIGEWLFPFVYGETFNRMYWPTLLILPGIWALSVMVLLAAYFSGKGNVKINIYGGLLSVVIVLAGNYFFTFRYGMIAAAFISTVAYFSYMFFLLSRFQKEYNVPIADFFIPKRSDLDRLARQFTKLRLFK